jgi:hypothetical protein
MELRSIDDDEEDESDERSELRDDEDVLIGSAFSSTWLRGFPAPMAIGEAAVSYRHFPPWISARKKTERRRREGAAAPRRRLRQRVYCKSFRTFC